MTCLKLNRVAASMMIACAALAFIGPAHAQPMMGEMGMHHNNGHIQEQMAKHWETRQAAVKTKLHLSAAQEPAWNAYAQNTKPPSKPVAQPPERDAMAKLKTPERLDKITAAHEANLSAMQAHIKQRNEATRVFYAQLNSDQQKIFDTETLPERSFWKGKHD